MKTQEILNSNTIKEIQKFLTHINHKEESLYHNSHNLTVFLKGVSKALNFEERHIHIEVKLAYKPNDTKALVYVSQFKPTETYPEPLYGVRDYSLIMKIKEHSVTYD